LTSLIRPKKGKGKKKKKEEKEKRKEKKRHCNQFPPVVSGYASCPPQENITGRGYNNSDTNPGDSGSRDNKGRRSSSM